jgi:hypothetical protein
MTTLLAGVADIRTTEQRWADWVARGAVQDRISQRRAVSLAITVACAIAVWLAIAFIRGQV